MNLEENYLIMIKIVHIFNILIHTKPIKIISIIHKKDTNNLNLQHITF